MKTLFCILATAIALATAQPVNAKQCLKYTVSWDASPSTNIKFYTVYNKGEPLGNTLGLDFEAACLKGAYQVTATNIYGLESIKTDAVVVEVPKRPANIKIIIELEVTTTN